MEANYFYLDTERYEVFMVVSRMVSGRMKVRHQDGMLGAISLEGFSKYLLLGKTFEGALGKYPELEYELRLCLMDDLD